MSSERLLCSRHKPNCRLLLFQSVKYISNGGPHRSYHKPSSLFYHPFERCLDALEDYWDSEWPRVGEQGANGWAAWEVSGRPEYEHPSTIGSKTSRKLPEPQVPDPFQRWATTESLADKTLHLPTRSTDSEPNFNSNPNSESDTNDDADPYSTILFTDIRPLLVPLTTLHSKHTFRLIWLSFLGLHIPGLVASLGSTPSATATAPNSTPPTQSTDDRWTHAHLASSSYLSALFPPSSDSDGRARRLRITADAQAGVVVGRERRYEGGLGPVRAWGYGVVGALEEVGGRRMWVDVDVGDVDLGMVREVFRRCRGRGGGGGGGGGEGSGDDDNDGEWDVLALAFEAAVNPKT